MDGADNLDETIHARCVTTGQMLFWRKQRSLREVTGSLSEGAFCRLLLLRTRQATNGDGLPHFQPIPGNYTGEPLGWSGKPESEISRTTLPQPL
jgi:hypothetical protein